MPCPALNGRAVTPLFTCADTKPFHPPAALWGPTGLSPSFSKLNLYQQEVPLRLALRFLVARFVQKA